MALYQITSPDGSVYRIEGPDNATQEQLIGAVMQQQRTEQRAASQRRLEEARAARYTKTEPDETSFGGNVGEFFKGVVPGAVGLVESAAVGASSLLSDESEKAAREKIKEIAGIAKKPFEAKAGYEESVGRRLGEGIGSFLPVAPLGLLGLPGIAAGVGVGVASGAGEARVRAEAEKASQEQRGTATALGTVPGAFDTIVDMTLGAFPGGAGKAIGFIRRALISGGVEGATEAAQEVTQNAIAKGVYKPEQELLTGAGEAGATGAGVGVIASLILDMAIPGRRRGAGQTPTSTPEETRAPAPPTAERPQGELFPIELTEAQKAKAEQAGPPAPAPSDFALEIQEPSRQMELPLEMAPEKPVKDERQPDLIDLLEEQQLAELDRVQKMEPIIGGQNKAEVKRIQDRNAAEVNKARLKFESDLAELDGRIQAKEEKTAEEKRLSILLPIAEAVVPGNIPKLFVKELKAQGFTNANLTDRERALIDRIYSFREATPVEPTPTPVSPETEELQSLVPEKKAAREPEQLGIPGIGKRLAPEAEPEVAPAEPEFPTVLTADVLDKTGLPRQSGFYRQLLNMDMADPGQQQLVADVLQRVRANPNLSKSTKTGVENIAGQGFGALATQQEMFGPRGGILKPEGGKSARTGKPEPGTTGISPEGTVGGRGGRGVKPTPSGTEGTVASAEAGLGGGRGTTKPFGKAKAEQPTTVKEPEGEKKTTPPEGTAKKTEPSGAGRGAERTTEGMAKKPAPTMSKVAPAKETKAPSTTETTKDVKKELTTAQKQAVDNYLGVTDGKFDKALEYLAGDIYNGSADYFDAKKQEYKQIRFGVAGTFVPGTGGKFGQNFFDSLSDADKKKVMDMVAKFREQEVRGEAITAMNQLAADIREQFDTDSLELNYLALISGPVHPAVKDAVESGNLKKALQILGEKLEGTLGKAAIKLADNIGKTKVEIVKSLKNEKGELVPGLYDPKTDTIKLDAGSGMMPHVLLHEVTHATTAHVLENKGHPVTKQLTELFNDVKDSLDTAYGAESLDEFVAEAFSNPEFQAML